MSYLPKSCLLMLMAVPALACDLKIESAWIRTAPPTASVLAGYAKLINTGSRPLKIAAIRSVDFADIQAHETLNEGGMSKMRAIAAFEIPAHGSVGLQPGGKHLMLLQPKRALQDGDVANLVFDDAAGCATTAAFKVSAAPPAAALDYSKMDHSKMSQGAN